MLDLLLCPLCPSYLSACPPLPCLVRCSESLARSLRLPSSAIPQRLGCTIWLLCAATIPSIIAELLALLSYSAFVDITVQNKSCSGSGSEKWPAGASVPLPVPVVASLGHDSLIHFGRRGGLLGLAWLAGISLSIARFAATRQHPIHSSSRRSHAGHTRHVPVVLDLGRAQRLELQGRPARPPRSHCAWHCPASQSVPAAGGVVQMVCRAEPAEHE